jgi:type IV pilus assembly protein PilM
MAERVMTLYLEDTNIRLLIARGKQAERWASMPLEPGLVSGGVIVNETQVAQKIRELLTTVHHIKTRTAGGQNIQESIAGMFGGQGKIVVGLSGRDSLYRVLSLPPLPESLLGEAVRREAGRVLPVSLNELYLAYQRIPGSATETRVFVVAFPRKATDILISTLLHAGVKPKVLDLAPLALCNSVNEPRSVIVDARLDSLNIIIMAERVPQVIRSLILQSETKTLSENMPTITEEFSRTIAFYNSSHPQDLLNADVPVFVSGDLAAEPDTWKALVSNLNSKVTSLPSAIQYPEEFPVNDFIVNLGLAAKELMLQRQPGNYSLVNLNAMPASALPKPINPYHIAIPIVAVAGIAGIVLLWNGWQNTKNSTSALQSQLTNVQSQITSSNKSTAALTAQNQSIQAQIQPLQDKANVLTTKMNTLEMARNLTDSDMHQIVTLAPQTVSLATVVYTSTGVNVTGSSAVQQDILNYAVALRDTGGFNVVVSSINYSSKVTTAGTVIDLYNFSFQLK